MSKKPKMQTFDQWFRKTRQELFDLGPGSMVTTTIKLEGVWYELTIRQVGEPVSDREDPGP